MRILTQNLSHVLNSENEVIDKVFSLLRDQNMNDPNIFREGLLVLAKITGYRIGTREGIFELLERFIGTNQNKEVVSAAITLLTNRVQAMPGYRLSPGSYPNLWKNLVKEFIPDSSNKGKYPIRRRVVNLWQRFDGPDLVKLFDDKKAEVYPLLCIFKISDMRMLEFIAKLIENDDQFIEVCLEHGILDILDTGIDGKNQARNDVVNVVTSIISSRSIYLAKVMEHKIWKTILTHSTKKQLSNFGALLAIGILKALGQIASLDQIYEMLNNSDIITKCLYGLRRNYQRNSLDKANIDKIIDKLIKLSTITKNEMKSEIQKCVREIQTFSRPPEDRAANRFWPRGHWVLAI